MATGDLRPGDAVAVHSTFTGSWITGFVVEDRKGDGYRLRRTSDGEVLPAVFPARRVRFDSTARATTPPDVS